MFGLLSDRSIIQISGQDRKSLIQGLITNDINQINNKLLYSAMLNNKGRFLYDFFIFENSDSIFLDCNVNEIDEITKKLSFYKLRSKVEITKNTKLKVFYSESKQNSSDFEFIDPRDQKLNYRLYQEFKDQEDVTKKYHQLRINHKIPDGYHDLTKEKSLILEFNFDNLNAINYEKGCYIGQELTARTHHTGQIRKQLYVIKIAKNINLEKNSKIKSGDKDCGIILSSYNQDNDFYALALIKNEFENSFDNLAINNEKITIIN